jgi:tripeptide aminopeptidase
MIIESERLVRLFLELTGIDAVSLQETPVAAFIRDYLDGTAVTFIDAGRPPSGTCDNLICIPRKVDPSQPVTLLCAHMDTVRSTSNLRPVIERNLIRTDGSTILGADNRAGVAALLYTLKRISENNLTPGNVAFVFTVAEEIGTLGAKHLDLSYFRSIEHVFVFDCSRRPGIFIQHCYGCVGFTVDIIGKSAHAGVNPEAGINAIAIAAEIIAQIPQGTLPGNAMCNIGLITGGEASNIVSPSVRFVGEVRGPSTDVIEQQLLSLEHIILETGQLRKGKSQINTAESFAPFFLEPSLPVYERAVNILNSVKLEPQPISYTGGSDANEFNSRGIPAINFGIGAQKPHSTDENISIEDLVKTTEIAMKIALKD